MIISADLSTDFFQPFSKKFKKVVEKTLISIKPELKINYLKNMSAGVKGGRIPFREMIYKHKRLWINVKGDNLFIWAGTAPLGLSRYMLDSNKLSGQVSLKKRKLKAFGKLTKQFKTARVSWKLRDKVINYPAASQKRGFLMAFVDGKSVNAPVLSPFPKNGGDGSFLRKRFKHRFQYFLKKEGKNVL